MIRNIVLLFLFTPFFGADAKSNNSTLAVKALVESAQKEFGFNGSVLVGTTTQVIFYQQFGYADKERKIPLTENHVFNAGSIAKELTTIAILQLVERGQLKLTDPVYSHLPFLGEWAKDVTVEHLMTHTSGLERIDWIDNVETSHIITQLNAITQLKFPPGSDFYYGNLNIVLRALIVEKVAKTDFDAYLQQYIFIPAGMRDSVNPSAMAMHKANFVAKQDPNAILGMTMFTTPYDLYLMEKALSNGGLLSKESVQLGLNGDELSGQKQRARFDFGRYQKGDNNQLLWWEHDGSSHPDHHAIKYHDFANNIIIVLMSSDGDKSTLFTLKRKIAELLNNSQAL